MAFLVAIDGPAGSGKSSVSKSVAQRLGFTYIDTGAIYRSLAFAAHRAAVSYDNEAALADLAAALNLNFVTNYPAQNILLDGEDITADIRTIEMSQAASKVSRHPAVRHALLGLQQELGHRAENGAVMEGRDIGTVVFPHANIKFFVTASNEVRADRRLKELVDSGIEADKDLILAEIIERDKRDQTREAAPMRIAQDAIVVDTSSMDQQGVVDLICALIKKNISE